MACDFSADIAAIGDIAAVPAILDVICRTTGMGLAAVARVTEERWVACSVKDNAAFGWRAGHELAVETTLCRHVRQTGAPIVISHAALDDRYSRHLSPARYGFQSYISTPINLQGGRMFGTLFAIDPQPAALDDPKIIAMLKLFAELIGVHLDASERKLGTDAALAEERRTSDLRDQFIAVLGHDLRNPLAGISAGMHLIKKTPLTDQAAVLVTMVQSTVQRMTGLIDNILDFARGRLGDGIILERTVVPTLEPMLRQVINELQLGAVDQPILTEFHFDHPLNVDVPRLGQLFSNLLANALTHGDARSPVVVAASTTDDGLTLSVSNLGDPMPDDVELHLFQPFFRGDGRSSAEGLGLGLYISAEIAKAHRGSLSVTSKDRSTTFTLKIPAA